jgi:excisionase family DNA binding protein
MNKQIAISSDRMNVPKSYVTTFEAAGMLGVTLRTVQLWANRGILESWKTQGGHRRIVRDSVERLLARRGQQQTPPIVDPGVAPIPSAEALRILVVEDEPDLLRLYRMQLARWPTAPEVSLAGNGFEGLVLIGSVRPHLLIADLHTPEMDGFQMLRTLRTMPQLDAMEVVVVTGLDPADVAQRGGLPSGTAILPKPIPFPELERIAARVAAANACRIGGER